MHVDQVTQTTNPGHHERTLNQSRPHTNTRNNNTVHTLCAPNVFCGGYSVRETPGPIPNPEAKPDSADGTAHESVWESKTPPQNHSYIKGLTNTGQALKQFTQT